MPSRTARRALPVLALASGAALVACGGPPTAGDMAKRAEQFIEQELAEDPDAGGVAFDDATCEKPASTDTNTTFPCTSVGSDGREYRFTVTIVGRNSLDLVSQPPLPGRPAATTTTAATSTTGPASSTAGSSTTGG
jgi:hypothetical protein